MNEAQQVVDRGSALLPEQGLFRALSPDLPWNPLYFPLPRPDMFVPYMLRLWLTPVFAFFPHAWMDLPHPSGC